MTFIIDSSRSIKRLEFIDAKKLVKNLVTKLRDATASREALVLFGPSAKVKTRFGQHDTAEKFHNAVQNLRKTGGATRIEKALYVTVNEVLKSGREEAYKCAIIITDGVQSLGAVGLKDSSRPLRQGGVRVIAVGNGAGK